MSFFSKGHVKKNACGSGQRSKHGLGLPKRALLSTIHINNDMNINIHIDINMNIDITPPPCPRPRPLGRTAPAWGWVG